MTAFTAELKWVSLKASGTPLTLVRLGLVGGGGVAALLHGAQDVPVVRVEVVVEAQEVKLGVARLLGLQHDLELGALLGHEVGRPLDDGVGLAGRRLPRENKVNNKRVWEFVVAVSGRFRQKPIMKPQKPIAET